MHGLVHTPETPEVKGLEALREPVHGQGPVDVRGGEVVLGASRKQGEYGSEVLVGHNSVHYVQGAAAFLQASEVLLQSRRVVAYVADGSGVSSRFSPAAEAGGCGGQCTPFRDYPEQIPASKAQCADSQTDKGP